MGFRRYFIRPSTRTARWSQSHGPAGARERKGLPKPFEIPFPMPDVTRWSNDSEEYPDAEMFTLS